MDANDYIFVVRITRDWVSYLPEQSTTGSPSKHTDDGHGTPLESNEDRIATPDGPVFEQAWQIYDTLRTALLNKKYYACRLAKQRQLTFWLEWMLAAATSGTVATWAIWHAEWGRTTWAAVAGVATVMSFTKPLLNLSKEIERLTKLHTGFTLPYVELLDLVNDMSVQRTLSSEALRQYHGLRKRLNDLTIEDDPQPKKRLRRRCTKEVLEELAMDRFWSPRGDRHGNGPPNTNTTRPSDRKSVV